MAGGVLWRPVAVNGGVDLHLCGGVKCTGLFDVDLCGKSLSGDDLRHM